MKDGKPEVAAAVLNHDKFLRIGKLTKFGYTLEHKEPLIRLSDHEAVVAELEEDRRRLEFLIAKEAQVGWNREGEYCGVYASDGEDGYECLSGFGSFHESARAAIDAAMKK